MAILARKTGWFISCTVLKQGDKYTSVQMADTKKKVRVCHDDSTQKVFTNVYDAEVWILEGLDE
jgi:hypothetical protein